MVRKLNPDPLSKVIEYIPADGSTAEEQMTDEEVAYTQFQHEFADSDTYAKIVVFRQPGPSGATRTQRKLAFLFECGIDEYTYSQLLTKLRDEYGTGTYRLHGRDRNGGLLFNRSVEIEQAKVTAAAAAESTSEIMKSVQAMMKETQERTEQMLSRFMRDPQVGAGSAVDPFAMFERTLALLGTLGLVGAQRGAGGDQLIGELDKLVKLREVATLFTGEGREPNDSNFFDLAGKLVDKFGPAFVTAVAAQSKANPQPPALAAPAPMLNVPATIPAIPPPPTPNPSTTSMKSQVDILVSNAVRGVAAEAMADNILRVTPDSMLDALYDFIEAPGCVDTMAALNPAVNQHRPWFETLRASLIANLQPDDDGANIPPDKSTAE